MILLKEDREPVGSPAGSLLTLALDPGKSVRGTASIMLFTSPYA